MRREGAKEVAAHLLVGKPLRIGNCRTDGRSYYLFGNEIADAEGGPDWLKAKNRLLGLNPQVIAFTFAGWPSASTVRHLEVVIRHKFRRTKSELEIFYDGKWLPLDADAWYTFHCLNALYRRLHEDFPN